MSVVKNILLAIDCQEDFMDKPNSGLPVSGSMLNTGDLIKMIYRDIDRYERIGAAFFDEIHLTMDSHLSIHIGHVGFWRRLDGIAVEPGVIFTLNEKDEIVNAFEFSEQDAGTIVYTAHEPCLQVWAIEYIRQMVHAKKIYPLIWNTHCIRNQHGWMIEYNLTNAILEWKKVTGRDIFIHEKGENILTEMYSIMRATVPYEELIQHFDKETQDAILEYTCIPGLIAPFPEIRPYDQTVGNARNMSTRFNEPLFDKLCGNPENQHRLFIAGQAKSHCVNASTRDIVECIEKKGMRPDNVCIIENLMSNVVLPDNPDLTAKFKENGIRFIWDMNEKGVNIMNSTLLL